jgi:hypothetical protein
MYNPLELEMIEREEHRTRLRYAAAKEQALMNDGKAPTEDEAVLRKLEADWKDALQHLQRARRHTER